MSWADPMADIIDAIAETVAKAPQAESQENRTLSLVGQEGLAGFRQLALAEHAMALLTEEADDNDVLLSATRVSAEDLRQLSPAKLRTISDIYRTLFGSYAHYLLALIRSSDMSDVLRQLYGKRQRHAAALSAAEVAWNVRPRLTDTDIKDRLKETAEAAFALNRQWPPKGTLKGRSWLGGLPLLPAEMEWPRTKSYDQPMHFWAQIDCGDLPRTGAYHALPKDGLLLFFFDLDSDITWNKTSGASRVIHVPEDRIPGEGARPPVDLPEMYHAAGKQQNLYPDLYTTRKVAPWWPIAARLVEVFSPTRADLRHQEAVTGADMAYVHFTAQMAALEQDHSYDERSLIEYQRPVDPNTGKYKTGYVTLDAPIAEAGFPFCKSVVDIFKERFRKEIENSREVLIRRRDAAEPKERSRYDDKLATLTLADNFLGRLPWLPEPNIPFSAETATAVQNWLTSAPHFAKEIWAAMHKALDDVVRKSVHDPALCACLPDLFFESLAPSLANAESPHMLLGPDQNATTTAGGSDVRLLLLNNDPALEFMFCDASGIEFRIGEDDLKTGRFDRAYIVATGA